jgi:nucleotide-binding universal stress UspA family protein
MTTNQIVVGADTSSFSDVAVRWAGEEAKRKRATLILAHVWEHSPNYLVPTKDIIELGTTALEAASGLVKDLGIPVEMKMVEGPTVKALLAEAERADMLVLGSFGQGRIADAILGSVNAGCIRHASCPVVVIPQGMVEANAAAAASKPS